MLNNSYLFKNIKNETVYFGVFSLIIIFIIFQTPSYTLI